MTEKTGMIAEIIVFAVLEDEYPIGLEHIAAHYKAWNLGEPFQSIWRVGKDNIVRGGASLNEFKSIVANYAPSTLAKRCYNLLQMRKMLLVHLYRCYGAASA